jgi:hypothetical protein
MTVFFNVARSTVDIFSRSRMPYLCASRVEAIVPNLICLRDRMLISPQSCFKLEYRYDSPALKFALTSQLIATMKVTLCVLLLAPCAMASGGGIGASSSGVQCTYIPGKGIVLGDPCG